MRETRFLLPALQTQAKTAVKLLSYFYWIKLSLEIQFQFQFLPFSHSPWTSVTCGRCVSPGRGKLRDHSSDHMSDHMMMVMMS